MDFKRKLEDLIQHSIISYALMAAKEFGIFDVLTSANQPLTSHQVADAKQLKERYVREILGSLTSAELVLLSSGDDGVNRYYLHESAKQQIKEGFLSHLAMVTVLMKQYPVVKECIPLSGPRGNLYHEAVFDYFHEMSSSYRTKHRMENILGKVPGLRERLEQGISVIEFGSGSAHLLIEFAKMFPSSDFIASDIDGDVVAQESKEWGHISNLHFEKIDVCQDYNDHHPSRKFDWALTLQVIHDLPDPLVAMKFISTILKEDGIFTMYDMAGPTSLEASVGDRVMASYRSMSTFLCIPESYHQSSDSKAYGSCWGEETALSLLKEAGFEVDLIVVDKLHHVGIYLCQLKKPSK